ncbi:EAL domain-containing protein (putative c-di-GMP-specific phosphodiesterase class I) [Pseudomonas fluorescens]|uniref:EAL domain-containing response regulator n=1 Tax=Pseudomonas fluorescens TaxID=294 RepID=UPI0020A02FD3|nr:EAL domain-containing response regulator [Pseudomonas fluorescens]MCP1488437.1 EAL domain-containing protein (putative c-di-GMP-specific phosphodiesterase class I) [Pseudomonas fluorescens]
MKSFPLRVLVLEDHDFQRSVAVSMLRQLGCQEVFEAADGAQALDVLHTVGKVDIALCDLCMDGMDGLEFLQRVGHSGLVGSVIISSFLSADLRRAVQQIVSLLGLKMLGDVGKPMHESALRVLLENHLCGSDDLVPKIHAPIELANEDEVRRALHEQELKAWYQPKVNLSTGEVRGVEVLSRWQHPSMGIVSPAVFMPVLERCGLLDELLFAQMDSSLRLQQRARRAGFVLNLAFNLHVMQLTNSDLTSIVNRIIKSHNATGSSLTFEITESGLLEGPITSLETLVRLRMMGCQLSIDDFGAGFSSLQRLCQLPFNEIKLDGEFVRTLKHEPRCRAAITSTLALGDSLGMSVVIEGIENEEQHNLLLELGCTVGQGYLYARPMSGEDLSRWLDLPPTSWVQTNS